MRSASKERELGTAAIELVVGVALIMVPMAMIVLSFAPLLEARTFVRLASSELAPSRSPMAMSSWRTRRYAPWR